MLETLQKLGIAASFSRPGFSGDNAQTEAFFRTLKSYRSTQLIMHTPEYL